MDRRVPYIPDDDELAEREMKDTERDHERMEKDEKLELWDGYNDGHFQSVDEFGEWWQDKYGDGEPLSEFVLYYPDTKLAVRVR